MSFQMHSSCYLGRNSFSTIILSFQLSLFSISAWAVPPILSLPLFYNTSLFSLTLFFFLFFSCCLLFHKLPFISHVFLSLFTSNQLSPEGMEGSVLPGKVEQWSPGAMFCSSLSSCCQHFCNLFLSSSFCVCFCQECKVFQKALFEE